MVFSMLIPSESTPTSYWLRLSLGSDNPYNYLNNSKRLFDPFTTVTTDNTRFLSSTLTPSPHSSQNDYFTLPEPLQCVSIAFRTSSKLYLPNHPSHVQRPQCISPPLHAPDPWTFDSFSSQGLLICCSLCSSVTHPCGLKSP